jgi:uncharacterized protein (TIGR03000 family)
MGRNGDVISTQEVAAMRWSAVGLVLLLSLLACGPSTAQVAKTKGKRATLIVRLPEAGAKLTIEGSATTQKGAKRRFVSPALVPGRQYTYTLVATWEPNNYTTIIRTKEVTVEAGKTTIANLREEDLDRRDEIVARFVPTPDDIVEAMCRLGEVGKNDVVYDLGCGDGIIIITAVKEFGAKKGVGIDLDPERVEETENNAKEAGVADKIVVRQGDLLKLKEADIADATVVMLYVGEDLNLRLRPLLQKALKPGARIVSHHFTMGDWRPTKSEYHEGEDEEGYSLHMWRIEKK